MDSKTPHTARCRQHVSAIIANLAPFSIGVMTGWTSPMQPLLMSQNPPVGSTPFTTDDISWVGSINAVGGVIGTLFWGKVSDKLGRKKTGYLTILPFIISWIIMLCAQNVYWMVISRITIGIGCSGTIINIPMYVSEIAENKIRGTLGSYVMLFLNAGILFSYIVGSFSSFHLFVSICLSIPLVHLIFFIWLPESPVYLYTHGKKSEAEESLLWFRGGDSVTTAKEMALMESRTARPNVSVFSLFNSKGTVKAFIVGASLLLGQQFCGIMSIITYTVSIFQESGSTLTPHASAIVVGSLQFCSAWVSTVLVDKTGRKFLLSFSFILMALSSAVLGTYFFIKSQSVDVTNWTFVPIISLSLHVIAYAIGAGPVPIIVMAETFSPEIRGVGISSCQFLGLLFSFITVKLFPTLTSLLGDYGAFWFFGICCVICTIFTILVVPETKGRTMENILQQLNGEIPCEKTGEDTDLCNSNKVQIVKTISNKH
ncbi:facilitated trehalose transporter Tret1-like [Lycorma delicatula]|uniref:facilitated trehalose transporter Tret1-like n=1 Tax=Lycorma delicatula TaxID=130591 RepID=UPI003F51714E